MNKYEGEEGLVWKVNFKHTYLANSFLAIKGRHACLRSGYWCFENFREYPKDIIKYLRKKL